MRPGRTLLDQSFGWLKPYGYGPRACQPARARGRVHWPAVAGLALTLFVNPEHPPTDPLAQRVAEHAEQVRVGASGRLRRRRHRPSPLLRRRGVAAALRDARAARDRGARYDDRHLHARPAAVPSRPRRPAGRAPRRPVGRAPGARRGARLAGRRASPRRRRRPRAALALPRGGRPDSPALDRAARRVPRAPLREVVGTSLALRPLQSPRPPMWFGGSAERAIELLAELADTAIGDSWVPSASHLTADVVAAQAAVFRRALTILGKLLPRDFPLLRNVVVAPDQRDGVARRRPRASGELPRDGPVGPVHRRRARGETPSSTSPSSWPAASCSARPRSAPPSSGRCSTPAGSRGWSAACSGWAWTSRSCCGRSRRSSPSGWPRCCGATPPRPVRTRVSLPATPPCGLPRRSVRTPFETLDCRNTPLRPAPASRTVKPGRTFRSSATAAAASAFCPRQAYAAARSVQAPQNDFPVAVDFRHHSIGLRVTRQVRVRVAQDVVPDEQVRIARAESDRLLHRRHRLPRPARWRSGSARGRRRPPRGWDRARWPCRTSPAPRRTAVDSPRTSAFA